MLEQAALSQMAETLKGSEIIKLAGEVKAKIAAGEKIYNLTIGDFDPQIFPIPENLESAIRHAYINKQTNYPAANGMQPLRSAAQRYIQHYQGLDYSEDDILISAGARPLIFGAYQCIMDPQDQVLYPVPSWNNNHYTHLSRGNGIAVQTTPESNFLPTVADLAPHISKARIVALCSPLNPTGTAFTREELGKICELILEENKRREALGEKSLFLIYDQIYSNLVYGETRHFDPVSLFPEMRAHTLFVDGMSKVFAATGVRVGWGFGPTHLINRMKAYLSHVGAWSPKAEQMGAAEFLSNQQDVDQNINQIRSEISQRLDAFYEGFMKLKAASFNVDAIAPQAALYLTVKFDLVGKQTADGHTLQNMPEVTRYLLEEAQTALVPFYAFGADPESPWFRLSIGTTRIEDIPDIFERLNRALAKLS